ncbi:uncharacterized protein LOC128990930 [Macrosteles quadrilineatus]|uniref:uncharacterized protein LOC128990930 n=1 Tax=Macrosteles quadrilineatus TaxID=74068 RepID=UPI0023E2446E|nr:uncharacterized protein LOC128990930 [Macrosteles quadrilineatus]
MLVLVAACVLSSVSVGGFKIVSKIDPVEDVESFASAFPRPEIGSPLNDYSTYEAVFAGKKKPISVDCTQPGVICKFPLVVDDEEASTKPAKVRAVPVIKGVDAPKTDEDSKVHTIVFNGGINTKVPVRKESLDVEVAADEKDIEDTWILEKNIQNKKYKIPVKLVPSKQNPGVAPVYPMHHDYHDHFNGHPYNFPSRHGQWTPWIRSYPSVYNYPSSQPCQPPVYHHPPPCVSAVAPTRKPTINIDDKVDKEED